MSKGCVVLLSGGLDSLLALRLMTLQDLRVTAVHTVNCFHGSKKIAEKKEALTQSATALGARDIVFPDLTDEVLALTRNPKHGYGRHLNACIDCRLRTVAAGFAVMREIGADFVVTGEVVGQRPMSQRRDALGLANRTIATWGYPGLLLRPLSAKLLDTTIPEAEGWVRSEYLYDISGRSRDRQMTLAREIGLGDYPTPAGGCLLTDPGFSQRLAILMRFTPGWNADDVELLKLGRHFQIGPNTKVVASRCEEENIGLRECARPDDRLYINIERPGAIVLLRGERGPEAEELASGLAVYYSKGRDQGMAKVARWRVDGEDVDKVVFPAQVAHPDRARALEMEVAGTDSLKVMRTR